MYSKNWAIPYSICFFLLRWCYVNWPHISGLKWSFCLKGYSYKDNRHTLPYRLDHEITCLIMTEPMLVLNSLLSPPQGFCHCGCLSGLLSIFFIGLISRAYSKVGILINYLKNEWMECRPATQGLLSSPQCLEHHLLFPFPSPVFSRALSPLDTYLFVLFFHYRLKV